MRFPKKVRICEVGPRDGFQSVVQWIETADKIEVVKRLFEAGVDLMEATSFVSPKAIPQMQDAAEIVQSLKGTPYIGKAFALVPNKKGADRAVENGLSRLAMVISASESHNMSNVRKTPAQSLEELTEIRKVYPQTHIKLSLATAFGCPFGGEVPMDQVQALVDGAVTLGIHDICLCDTIGVAVPTQVSRIVAELKSNYPQVDWSLHLHNTRGLAAANTVAALEEGIDRFETAAGGLGGCPFAPGASGNMATEDLVYLLDELGIATGVKVNKVIATTEFMTSRTGCSGDSKINSVTIHKIFQGRGDV